MCLGDAGVESGADGFLIRANRVFFTDWDTMDVDVFDIDFVGFFMGVFFGGETL